MTTSIGPDDGVVAANAGRAAKAADAARNERRLTCGMVCAAWFPIACGRMQIARTVQAGQTSCLSVGQRCKRRRERNCKGGGGECPQTKTRPNCATWLGGPRRPMSTMLDGIGRLIARYLQKPVPGYEPFTPSDPDALRQSLQPGDVLLVEGNNRIAGVIKYLTQSTWSHSALYVGPLAGHAAADGEPHVLIEANVGEGVVSAPLSKYLRFHTRICRPVGLTEADCAVVCAYAVERIGFAYDLKNIIDLLRYLLPLPVPRRWR